MSKVAAHGAVAVQATIPPGATRSLRIIFAWHFPDRDYSGEILGNKYADFWPNSSAVARELGREARLAGLVADINSHHKVVAHEQNPTPTWLKDMLVNQWSHY